MFSPVFGVGVVYTGQVIPVYASAVTACVGEGRGRVNGGGCMQAFLRDKM